MMMPFNDFVLSTWVTAIACWEMNIIDPNYYENATLGTMSSLLAVHLTELMSKHRTLYVCASVCVHAGKDLRSFAVDYLTLKALSDVFDASLQLPFVL